MNFLRTGIMVVLWFGFFLYGNPNEEFRATWVITWDHISSNSTAEESKARIREIMDDHFEANMTSVLFQVRQSGTAYYNSSFEPRGYFAGYENPHLRAVHGAIYLKEMNVDEFLNSARELEETMEGNLSQER